jgi:hypothetical protein
MTWSKSRGRREQRQRDRFEGGTHVKRAGRLAAEQPGAGLDGDRQHREHRRQQAHAARRRDPQGTSKTQWAPTLDNGANTPCSNSTLRATRSNSKATPGPPVGNIKNNLCMRGMLRSCGLIGITIAGGDALTLLSDE